MKTSRGFTQPNRIPSFLRFGSGVTLISAAAALALVAVKPSSSPLATSPELQWTEDGKMSAAFAKHREDLFAAKVGAAGESPASWADENYQLNGGDQITASDIAGARTAFSKIQKAGIGKGKTSTASWFSLGPKNAIYPAFLNRHGSQYVTSGRITALAIGPTCTLNSCTLWVAAAGGGVWKTDKALGGANWVNVSDGFFGSGAIGALTYDAAHNALYAGTGEDAAAGDAEAGVGVYKSTDLEPIGRQWEFHQPGNPNHRDRSQRCDGQYDIRDKRPRRARHLFDNRGCGLPDPAGNARCRRLEVDGSRSDVHAAPAQHRRIGSAAGTDIPVKLRIVSRRNGRRGRSNPPRRDLRLCLQCGDLAFERQRRDMDPDPRRF